MDDEPNYDLCSCGTCSLLEGLTVNPIIVLGNV